MIRFAGGAAVLLLVLAGCTREKPVPPVQPEGSVDAIPIPDAELARPEGILPSFEVWKNGPVFERFDDISPRRRIIEVTGGGVGITDIESDGWPDLLLTNGCRLPLDPTDRNTPTRLFRNERGLNCPDVSSESGLQQFGFAQGTAVTDFNADGFEDIYVTAFGPNVLWLNNGDGTYTQAEQTPETEVRKWSSSAAAADLNGDGNTDLYVVNYLDESDTDPRLCPNPTSPDGYEGCSPALFDGVDDVVLLSDGAGGFRNVSADAGITGLKGKGLGVVACDFDRDGNVEIYVANDGQANFLFVQDGEDGSFHFRNDALVSNVAFNDSGHAQAGMGIAFGDYDRNGYSDLFLTHFYGDSNTLYANQGQLQFLDQTRAAQLAASSRRMLGFGTVFIDTLNSGWLDLFVANGHIDDLTWAGQNIPYRMRPQLYRNESSGTFLDVSEWAGSYFGNEWLGRGTAVADFNRDGRQDLAINNQLAKSVCLLNIASDTGRSLRLGLKRREGIAGTRVEVQAGDAVILREVVGGASYLSASEAVVHVGLGEANNRRATVTWPSGEQTELNLEPGSWVLPAGEVARRLPW